MTLAGLSIGFAALRYHVMGQETKMPPGPGNYHVTLVVRGNSQGDARLLTLCPLDVHHQHIYGEEYASGQLYPKPSESKEGDKRQIVWTQRALVPKGPIEVRYEFFCNIDVHRPNVSMARVNKLVHSPPEPGEWLHAGPGVDPSHPDISTCALDATAGCETPIDQVYALFQFVDQNIRKEPAAGNSNSALECLQNGRGDALAKARLLVALCRNRGLPSRLASGIVLSKKAEQKPHVWVETWVEGAWMALCPYYHHCGKVPPNYLLFGFGDLALVRGLDISDIDYAFLVEAKTPGIDATATAPLQQFFQRISLFSLPPAEWRLVEFLLLLPVAALVICVYRNMIGLPSFGTFAPALIGLAFREDHTRPGMIVFVAILLVGWCLRRVLDRYHLLQVPRTAFMLSLIVVMLIGLIVAANFRDIAATRFVSLFPMIILTGMVERFWTNEAEDGAWSSFKILVCTLASAASIAWLTSFAPLVNQLVNYPETIGVVMACQLLMGRYTGYRLSELFRFRDFVKQPEVKAIKTRLRISSESDVQAAG